MFQRATHATPSPNAAVAHKTAPLHTSIANPISRALALASHAAPGSSEDRRRYFGAPHAEGPPARTAPARPQDEGAALDPSTRSYFEQRFRSDLSRVRVHAGDAAARAAQDERAQAFTRRDDVFFARGKHSPGTPAGRWLLAHELAHVAQQRNPPSPDHEVEAEARRAATLASAGHEVRLRKGRSPGATHRFGEPENVPNLTYVTTQGSPGFLSEAVAYHTAWGLNPIRIGSVQAVVNDLARRSGVLSRVRIVMHAADLGVFSSLFAGEPLYSLDKDRLNAWADSDAQGLIHDVGATFNVRASVPALVADVRSAHAPMLQPFGIDQAGDATGALATLFQRTAQRFFVAASRTPANASGVATVLTSMDIILAGDRAAAMAQGNISDADARALQTAITTSSGHVFGSASGWSPAADTVSTLQAANLAVTGNFRGQLGLARGRFDATSWIDIRGCRAGDDPDYLRAVSSFFGAPGARPHVSGPTWYQTFPTLGWRTLMGHADLDTIAADANVQAALTRWAQITGVRTQLDAWQAYYRYEIARRRSLAAATQPPAGPGLLAPAPTLQLPPMPFILPPLGGGLTTPPAEEMTARLFLTTSIPATLPRLQAPSLTTTPPRFGAPTAVPQLTVTDPGISLAESALARLSDPNALLYYYFDADLVLPVAETNAQSVRLYVLQQRLAQAIRNWLGSQWASAAPGLAALQGGTFRNDQRRVQALVESHDPDADMVFPPDPRYWDHITTI